MQSADSVIAERSSRNSEPAMGATEGRLFMLFDDLIIEANRDEVRRHLRSIYANRQAVETALGGRPAPVQMSWLKSNWFSALFMNRNRPQVEYLEPLAARVRND